MTAATHTRQASRTPLGLALLLERGGATLVAPARTLAAGVVLEAFAAGVEGARPGSTAGCRGRRCVVREVGLKVELAALEAWVLGRVSGGLPGWSVEQVLVDMSEGTGAVWTLRGRDEAGATAWLRVELAVVVDAGRVRLRAGRCWWLGPPGSTAARQWRALGRKLCGGGVGWVRGELVVEVLRAAVGAEFAAAGRGRSAADVVARRTRPALRISSSREARSGTICATGVPRSVMVITSPAAARRTTSDAFCLSDRIPTVVMCYKVAPDDSVPTARV